MSRFEVVGLFQANSGGLIKNFPENLSSVLLNDQLLNFATVVQKKPYHI